VQFKSYEVVPLRNFGEHCEQCEPRNAEFWGLYGIDENDMAYAIGDFANKSDAEFIKGAIAPN
jgi:hypothetical protein